MPLTKRPASQRGRWIAYFYEGEYFYEYLEHGNNNPYAGPVLWGVTKSDLYHYVIATELGIPGPVLFLRRWNG